MIRLVAIDLDGTALRPDRTISPAVRDAVRRAARRAIILIATARPPRSARAFARELGVAGPQVVYNGAATWDFDRSIATAHVPLASGSIRRIVAAARSMLPHCAVNVETLDRWFTDRVDARYVTETGRLFQPDRIAPLATFVDADATKLMIHAEPDEIDRLRAALTASLGERVLLLRTDPDLLQAVDPRAGKWAAIRAIAASHRIDAAEVLTIGDNENDVEMLRAAGVGVAVENGTPAARGAADWIAPSNRDDGVAVALDRFVNDS